MDDAQAQHLLRTSFGPGRIDIPMSGLAALAAEMATRLAPFLPGTKPPA